MEGWRWWREDGDGRRRRWKGYRALNTMVPWLWLHPSWAYLTIRCKCMYSEPVQPQHTCPHSAVRGHNMCSRIMSIAVLMMCLACQAAHTIKPAWLLFLVSRPARCIQAEAPPCDWPEWTWAPVPWRRSCLPHFCTLRFPTANVLVIHDSPILCIFVCVTSTCTCLTLVCLPVVHTLMLLIVNQYLYIHMLHIIYTYTYINIYTWQHFRCCCDQGRIHRLYRRLEVGHTSRPRQRCWIFGIVFHKNGRLFITSSVLLSLFRCDYDEGFIQNYFRSRHGWDVSVAWKLTNSEWFIICDLL